MSDRLKLTIGSTVPIEILLLDENGDPENIDDVTRAVFVIRETHDAATAVLQLDTDAADLSLAEKANGKLIGNITQVQSDALTAGLFVAECNLFFVTPANWQPTERFYVEIEPATAAALP